MAVSAASSSLMAFCAAPRVISSMRQSTKASAPARAATVSAMAPSANLRPLQARLAESSFTPGCSRFRAQPIARAANGVQQRRGETLVDLFPQPADVGVDQARVGIEAIIPDMLEQ